MTEMRLVCFAGGGDRDTKAAPSQKCEVVASNDGAISTHAFFGMAFAWAMAASTAS